jgi:outer membrane lipoprotein-sorting protein
MLEEDIPMKRIGTIFICLLIVTSLGLSRVEAADGREILRKVDDMWRGSSSAVIMTMSIKTEHWQRSLTMKGYSKGKDMTLVRIILPKQEAGTATLKVDESIWNYLPKTRRVMKIPSSMMMGSWMGSHFTNDDLVRESRLEDDYTFGLEEQTTDEGTEVYRLILTPRPEAPVVWGRIILLVRKDTLVPLWQEYYDEEEVLVRRATFSDVQQIGERLVPMTFRMVPIDKEGEYTEIKYEKLMFDVPLEDSFFSLQNLQRR